jgi:hypothetical protein
LAKIAQIFAFAKSWAICRFNISAHLNFQELQKALGLLAAMYICVFGAKMGRGAFEIVAFAHSVGMNRSVEAGAHLFFAASRRVGCSELMKFFLKKSSISTNISSLTGRGMAVEKSSCYGRDVGRNATTLPSLPPSR